MKPLIVTISNFQYFSDVIEILCTWERKALIVKVVSIITIISFF